MKAVIAPPRVPSPSKNQRDFLFADMAKLADALDLGSSGVTRAGSSPVIRISVKNVSESESINLVFPDFETFFYFCLTEVEIRIPAMMRIIATKPITPKDSFSTSHPRTAAATGLSAQNMDARSAVV